MCDLLGFEDYYDEFEIARRKKAQAEFLTGLAEKLAPPRPSRDDAVEVEKEPAPEPTPA
jgi:hypothetical protein